MSPELLTAVATFGTVLVIGASAVAALIQLRHMRASNELEALLSLQKEFQSPPVQAALHYVQEQLPHHMQDEHYRDELAAIGFISAERHPELLVCNWFTQMGTFLKHGLIGESTLMDLYARLVRYYWNALAPAVAIMRRKRGDGQYSEFEYLALRAAAWLERNSQGVFPRNVERAPLADPWRESDEKRAEGSFALKGIVSLERSR
ncbi:MAG TPA: hypothetical protein VFN37_02385 [Candidatus Baltobacteraceae bacterium]|nr:hypothetical protein [Candidatus Baltobacteraceae bacterium]